MHRQLTLVAAALVGTTALCLPTLAAEPDARMAADAVRAPIRIDQNVAALSSAHLTRLERALRSEARGTLNATVNDAFDAALANTRVVAD